MDEMRYIIVGAGAIGGTIGGRLFEAGHEVVLVARGPHLDALRAHGLRLVTPDGEAALPILAVGQPAELDLRDGDVLVLAVKTQDAEAVLAEWAWRPVRGGTLPIGRYPSGTDAMAAQIGADLDQSRFLAPVSADVMRWKYGKLLGNLNNAIEAVCGHDAGDAAADLRRRATAEGTAVLDAAGIGYASQQESADIRSDRIRIQPVNGSPRSGGSSWQSLARGTGSIEADYLNGEIVLLGRKHGVPAPVNEVLQRLANQAARERRAPGSATPSGVMALIDA
jgi:2-dehydropantoate 2-reductase